MNDSGNPFVILDFARFLGFSCSIDQTWTELVDAEMRKGATREIAEEKVREYICAITEDHFIKVFGPRKPHA